MSLSVGSSSDAQSYLQSLLQLGSSGAAAAAASAAPTSGAGQMFAGAGGADRQSGADLASSLLGASTPPFQSDTLSSLISLQGQGADAGAGPPAADGVAPCNGSGGGDQSGSATSDSGTTQTTTNADGSTTTTITYADGGVESTTTPAPTAPGPAAHASNDTPGNSSNGDLSKQLSKLQALLTPVASALLSVV
jgi:hypothetical protein